ncbi:MAG TPA: DUF1732 domain-containing protein [Planctomycetota bacterium]|nr:DUF1732 domain-containing protein [Planctomycetota bacterium]
MDRPSNSMTGAGFAAGASEVGDLRIEVRTVNGRGLAVKLRLTGACARFEAAIDALVRERLHRGTVSVIVERQVQATVLPDRSVLRAVAEELRQLASELHLPPPGLADVVQLASLAQRGEAATARALPPQLHALFVDALDDLDRHRRADGEGAIAAMQSVLAEFDGHCAAAAARAPQVAAAYRERLLARVQEFVQSHLPAPLPAFDLVREVAIYADRIDVAEELQRLRAHLDEIRAVLGRGGEVGRRVEFLLQELLRETNTLGSKSPDTALSHIAVSMKSGIDRLKEQAANLE